MNPNTSIATVEHDSQPLAAFANIQSFTDAQRMAGALSASKIVPEGYRGNIADCVIALEISNRIGASVLAVMQNLYIVHGKPAWSSQFLISCVNASRRFTPLRYRMTGTPGEDSWGCVAWAMDKANEKLEGPEVTIGMAKAEGWVTKNGSKWKTMPELMLRYRAATLFARLYAPELTMGIQSEHEVIDVESLPLANSAPVVTEGVVSFAAPQAALEAPAPAAVTPVRKRKVEFVKPADEAAAAAADAGAPLPQAGKPYFSQVAEQLSAAKVKFEDFAGWLKTTGQVKHDVDTGAWTGWEDVPEAVAQAIIENGTIKRCATIYGNK